MRVFLIARRLIAPSLLVAASAAQALVLDLGGGSDPFKTLTLMGAPPGARGFVELRPESVQLVVPGQFSAAAQAAFNADAAGQFNGWTFNLGTADDLLGTIRINQYLARDIPGEVFGRGGATMNATYLPDPGDPTTNLAWVNYFQDDVGGGRMHIDPFPNDDIAGGGTEGMPFYYNTNEGIGSLTFDDNPSDRVTSVPFQRSVNFETYLVGYDPAEINDGTAGGTITTYGGFSWGYFILVDVPEPASVGLLATAVGIVGAIGYSRRRYRADGLRH